MKALLDTNRLTDALRGEPQIVEMIERADEVWIPFITMAEIEGGFVAGTRQSQNEAALQKLLQLPGVDILFADRETTRVYARLFAHLRRTGTPIPTNDLWIASLAVQHHLILLTRDQHFRKLPQIVIA